MKATLGVRLPDDIEARLNTLAETTGRSKSYYAREAIIKHLEELEDIYLAESVLERIRRGKERTHTLGEVGKRLGLAD
jgi:RHH-type rel operon transcriptional repressor/antitoxin RelB